jgi:hypothetical protein
VFPLAVLFELQQREREREMENEDSAVQDFLEILEEHRKNCERQGKYVEAEIAKNRLEELKLHEENRRRVSSLSLSLSLSDLFLGGNAVSSDRGEVGSGGGAYVGVPAIQYDLGPKDGRV